MPVEHPERRPARVFAFILLGFAFLHAKAVENTPPQVLPQMKVSAGVPLVKVAEYKMREPRQAPAAIAHKGFIYIIGGLVSTGNTTDSIERFDPRTGQSEIIGHLRVSRMWHRAVLVGDKIYVIGGATPGWRVPNYLAQLEEAIAAARNSHESIVPPNSAGGQELEASVEIFDLTTRQLSRGSDLPEPRNQFASVLAGNEIYAIGGQREYRGKLSFTNTVEILDLSTNQWRSGVPMPTPRATDGALVSGGFIVVPGGYNGMFDLNTVEIFNVKAGTWRTHAPLTRNSSAHSAVFLGDYLFLFGDYESPERLLAYNLKTRKSETFTLGYTAARHTAAVVAEGKIYIVGGRAFRNSEPLRLIQVFEPTQRASPALSGPP